jgi:hypothetical protein
MDARTMGKPDRSLYVSRINPVIAGIKYQKILLGLGCHKHKDNQTLLRMIHHPVDLTGRSHSHLSRRQFLFLGPNGDLSLPFQQIIYLVRPLVGMHFLDLAGLETVYITKKTVRVEKADLVHLLGFKLHLIADVNNFHKIKILPMNGCRGKGYNSLKNHRDQRILSQSPMASSKM